MQPTHVSYYTPTGMKAPRQTFGPSSTVYAPVVVDDAKNSPTMYSARMPTPQTTPVTYTQPTYAQPTYTQSAYTQPTYTQPSQTYTQSAPNYAQSSVTYTQPATARSQAPPIPSYSQAQPGTYTQPPAESVVYTAPQYSGVPINIAKPTVSLASSPLASTPINRMLSPAPVDSSRATVPSSVVAPQSTMMVQPVVLPLSSGSPVPGTHYIPPACEYVPPTQITPGLSPTYSPYKVPVFIEKPVFETTPPTNISHVAKAPSSPKHRRILPPPKSLSTSTSSSSSSSHRRRVPVTVKSREVRESHESRERLPPADMSVVMDRPTGNIYVESVQGEPSLDWDYRKPHRRACC